MSCDIAAVSAARRARSASSFSSFAVGPFCGSAAARALAEFRQQVRILRELVQELAKLLVAGEPFRSLGVAALCGVEQRLELRHQLGRQQDAVRLQERVRRRRFSPSLMKA